MSARAKVRVVPDIRWDAQRMHILGGTLLAFSKRNSDTIGKRDDPHRGSDQRREGQSEDYLPDWQR